MSLWDSVAVVIATLVGPVLAVQAQKYLERRRAAHDRRLAIFRTLFTTRRVLLSASHVEALNMIDIEFQEPERRYLRERKEFKRVRSAWGAYRDHLGETPPTDQALHPLFYAKRDDLLFDLLAAMAAALGFEDIDKTYLNSKGYVPQWHVDVEGEITRIRKGLAGIFEGKASFPMSVTSFPFAVEPSLAPLAPQTPPSSGPPNQTPSPQSDSGVGTN